jgi:hypothetical protein
MAIEGKVAAILNEREIIINKGSDAGVVPNMIFGILEVTEGIKDPDTGEDLGKFEFIKIKVKAVDVQPKLAVCRTYETYQINVGGTGRFFVPDIFGPSQWVTKVKTLQYKDAPFQPLREEGSYVRVGDKVRELQAEIEQE